MKMLSTLKICLLQASKAYPILWIKFQVSKGLVYLCVALHRQLTLMILFMCGAWRNGCRLMKKWSTRLLAAS